VTRENPFGWRAAGLEGQCAGGAYGDVDELNSSIDVVRAFNAESVGNHPSAGLLEEELRWIQDKLFDVGGLLATAPGQAFKNMPTVTSGDVTRLEKLIDRCQKDLPPLKEFALPGCGKISSLLHQSRTICRRAERRCVRLVREEPLDPALVRFLNRLSDTLFVLARWMLKKEGRAELLWQRD
jgi:cob(I)alamin adenosyltransferase